MSRINRENEGLLSHAELSTHIKYDPVTGFFYALTNRKSKLKIGQPLGGSLTTSGYRRICVFQKHYYIHRLVWFYVHKKWPAEYIDHINMDRSDNRLCNLREANIFQNRYNALKRKDNTSGMKGISWNKRSNQWIVQINANKKKHFLGGFTDKTKAYEARLKAMQQLHGEFARIS
jgi:hypothetical protein